MRRYEIVLILPPDADEAAVAGVTERISRLLGERGGEIRNLDRWGRRKLAYEIRHLSEGFYVIVDCTADPDSIKGLERMLGISDDVVRAKVVVRAGDDDRGGVSQPQGTSPLPASHRPGDGIGRGGEADGE